MNVHPQFRKAVVATVLCSSLSWLVAPAQAVALDIAEQPLFLVGNVDPNIMLMIDNSGSMSNIVPDNPYDPSFPYNCPTGNQLSNSTAVSLRVTYSGYPYVRYGSSDYDWGISGSGATGKTIKCFNPSAQYDANLFAGSYQNNSGTSNDYSYYGSGSLPASYSGNYLNWYFGSNPSNNTYGTVAPDWGSNPSSSPIQKRPGTLQRFEIAKSASKSLIDNLGADNRVGLATYNGDNGGSLREVIGSLDAGKRTTMKSKIDALALSTFTPLAETLADIGRYFTTGYTNNLTLHPGQANQSTATVASVFTPLGSTISHSILNSSGVATLQPPIQYFCQKSFAVMLTDGRPTQDQAISSHLCDYDGDTPDSGGSFCPNFDKKTGQDYESVNSSDYLDDVAMALYEVDLRPDLSAPVGTLGLDDKNNVSTFMIGFADDQVINDPLMIDTAKNGGGLFLTAGNSQALIQAFDTIAATIKKDKPSAAALAANSTSVEVGAVVFQAIFDSNDWSGDLIAYPVNNLGVVNKASPYWQSGTKLTDASTRKIYTINSYTTAAPGSGAGMDFTWLTLSPAQQTSLNTNAASVNDGKGNDRLNWIRGIHDKEARKPGGEFRNRERTVVVAGVSSKQEWILGDIVNSDPVFMHKNDFGYKGKTWTGAADYSQYLLDKSASKPLVFIGGNSGVLHAFRADTADTDSGKELFAYVPNAVYPNLSNLSTVGYTHSYFVDGSPTIGDVYIGGKWRTVLVSGLGAGGKSVFALDVTEFAVKPPELASPSAAAIVKWEVSDADMGLTYSKPQIARLNNGEWAAIFGNGYNSTSEQAYLYVVNIETGAIKKFAAGTAGSNGLSTPALYDIDGDLITDFVYAGDLQGNLWKFDLSDKTTDTTWGVSNGGVPLFIAKNSASQAQAITAQPVIGAPPTVSPPPTYPGVMVYFGTGKYLQNVDISDSAEQTFYGIWDNNTAISATNRSTLQQQSISSKTNFSGATVRTTSANTVDWTTQRGWYMDFDAPTEPGERVVTQALLRYDRVIFLTLVPSTVACLPGGSSWLMELDAITGSSTAQPNFDFNNDGVFDSSDNVAGSVVSGYQSTVGITKPPAWFTGVGGKDYKVMTGTTGGIESLGNRGGVPPSPPPGGAGSFRRTYWLQIQ